MATTTTTTTSVTTTTVRAHPFGPLLRRWTFRYSINATQYADRYDFTEVRWDLSGGKPLLAGHDVTRNNLPVLVSEQNGTFSMVEKVPGQCFGYFFTLNFLDRTQVVGTTYTYASNCATVLDGPIAFTGTNVPY